MSIGPIKTDHPIIRVDYRLGIDNFTRVLAKSGDTGDESTTTKLVFKNIPYYPEKEYLLEVTFFQNVQPDPDNQEPIIMRAGTKTQIVPMKDIAERASPINISVPSLVARPVISSDYSISAHPKTGFKIKIDGFAVNGNGKKKAITIFLLDIYGEIIDCVIEDQNNLGYYDLSDIVLEEGKLYQIKAMFHSTTNDVSEPSSFIFITTQSRLVKPVTNINSIVIVKDSLEHFRIQDIQLSTGFDVELYSDGLLIYSGKATDENLIIPSFMSFIKEGSKYLLGIRPYISHKQQQWEYLVLRTVTLSDSSLPAKLPMPVIS